MAVDFSNEKILELAKEYGKERPGKEGWNAFVVAAYKVRAFYEKKKKRSLKSKVKQS